MGARKSGSSHTKERSKSPPNPFQFNQEDIIHPRSADWAPAQAVTDYLQKLQKGFDKEDLNRCRNNRKVFSSKERWDMLSTVNDRLQAFEFPLWMLSKFLV
ncbi:hypothetical protein NDU88_000998 [Pleurodeles waltl]|uniref:Uncharacterized protein n=1 Tax=Pleurodeles waltl TaxID=8319 RepID=A0AAV7KSA6_PLEWA|nr:hypothetical protein NDU88_000998 [Pleurodeles waltl]